MLPTHIIYTVIYLFELYSDAQQVKDKIVFQIMNVGSVVVETFWKSIWYSSDALMQ